MTGDSLILDAISAVGTILAFLATTLLSMAIAGVFKELSGKVRRLLKKLSRKGYK